MLHEKLIFTPPSRRQIEADFSGGHITSDVGLLLLREVDKQHQLTQRLAGVLDDAHNPGLVRKAHCELGEKVSATYRFNTRPTLGNTLAGC